MHPNGKGKTSDGKDIKGRPVLIDDSTGEVLGGMGGKFNGRHISAVPQHGKLEQAGAQMAINYRKQSKKKMPPTVLKSRRQMSPEEKAADDKLVETFNFGEDMKGITKETDWGSIEKYDNESMVQCYIDGDAFKFGVGSDMSNAQILRTADRLAKQAKEAKNKGTFQKWKRQTWFATTGESEFLYPEKIAGVDWDYPMTEHQANGGKVNPNYYVGGNYENNCQTCVVAYEARRRGYDIVAGPNDNAATRALSVATYLAWIDPFTNKPPKPLRDNSIKTPGDCMDWINETVQKGGRYVIQWAWKGRSGQGHIVFLERDKNNNLTMYDPQSGKHMDYKGIEQLTRQMKFRDNGYYIGPQILQVDNLIISPEYRDAIFKSAKS